MTIRFLKQFTNIVCNKGNSMIILFGFNTSRYRRRYREYGKVFYEAKMFHMSKYMMCIRKLVKFKTGKKLGKKVVSNLLNMFYKWMQDQVAEKDGPYKRNE